MVWRGRVAVVAALLVAAGLALAGPLAGRAHAAGAPPALAYIANKSAGRISVVDTSTNTVTGTIAVGSGPSEMAVNQD